MNSDVRVIIDSVPGQLDAATEVAIALGGSVETNYRNLLQVVVPITSLIALAETIIAALPEGRLGNYQIVVPPILPKPTKTLPILS